jgi:integrase/recombinase XerD
MRQQLKLSDDRERAVVDLWRRGHLSEGSIQLYLQWIRRFRAFCKRNALAEIEELTLAGVSRFCSEYSGPRVKKRRISAGSRAVARNALHAWACALQALGIALPLWREVQAPPVLPPLLEEYRAYRRAHNGVAETTLRRDLGIAQSFLAFLRGNRRTIERLTIAHVDCFVKGVSATMTKGTVADICSYLRAFLRFLYATGKLSSDLACNVVGPRFRLSERPPRTLPWQDVKRILQAVKRKESPGKRDFAILLLLSAYGMGAAEVLSLRLRDIDWKSGILHIRRPKTNVRIELPLLPAVAKALTDYLRWERPPVQSIELVFLRKNMPYVPMTSGAIRHRVRYYADLAGLSAKVLGAHIFRHSHASRQVDSGANLKIVSEILGHRSSSSTSVYVRVALKRLRSVGLPVPS